MDAKISTIKFQEPDESIKLIGYDGDYYDKIKIENVVGLETLQGNFGSFDYIQEGNKDNNVTIGISKQDIGEIVRDYKNFEPSNYDMKNENSTSSKVDDGNNNGNDNGNDNGNNNGNDDGNNNNGNNNGSDYGNYKDESQNNYQNDVQYSNDGEMERIKKLQAKEVNNKQPLPFNTDKTNDSYKNIDYSSSSENWQKANKSNDGEGQTKIGNYSVTDILIAFCVGIVILLLMGFLLQVAWNHSIHEIFGWGEIKEYYQSVCLIIVIYLLSLSFGLHSNNYFVR